MERGESYSLRFALDFFLIHLPEALVLLFIGLSLYGISIRSYGYRSFLFGLLYAIPSLILSFYEVNLPAKLMGLFVWMVLLIWCFLRESLSLSMGISSSAFILFHGIQFLFISIISSNIEQPTLLYQHTWVQIGITWLYLGVLIGMGILLLHQSFNIRDWIPQTIQNRYLAIIILFGSVELLSILTLNANYLMILIHPKNPTGIHHQLPFFHGVVLILFVLIIILFRIYLNLTIHRVEHETPTPYLQNLNDLITAIRSIKHDSVNHYTAINGLVKLGSYDRATDYVKQLINEASTIITVVDGVKNPTVSALLHSKMAMCIANRIPLSIAVTSKSQFRFIRSNELATVMGNLLDHAIRAALDEEEDKRFIRMIWEDEDTNTSLLIEHSGQLIPAIEAGDTALPSNLVKTPEKGGVDLSLLHRFVNRYKGTLHLSTEKDVTRILMKFN